jgi:hypothetical protein
LIRRFASSTGISANISSELQPSVTAEQNLARFVGEISAGFQRRSVELLQTIERIYNEIHVWRLTKSLKLTSMQDSIQQLAVTRTTVRL